MITFSPTTTTRGQNFKLFKQQSRLQIRSNFYFNKIINDWNNLSQDVVMSIKTALSLY